MSPLEIEIALAVGFVAGLLGGLLGLGGSLVIIPALAILLGPNQHLYQAAAMIVNVVVALVALPRHYRSGSVDWRAAQRMLPAGLAAILLGVALSNRLDGLLLQRLFALFLLYFAATEILRSLRDRADDDSQQPRLGWPTMSAIGAVMGALAGLLGLGGGVASVPLLRRFARLPVRRCIGTSAAVMVVTAAIGSLHKNLTLGGQVGPDGEALAVRDSLLLAAVLVPTAIAGSFLGARLTYRLPLATLRVVLAVLIAIGALRMSGAVEVAMAWFRAGGQ